MSKLVARVFSLPVKAIKSISPTMIVMLVFNAVFLLMLRKPTRTFAADDRNHVAAYVNRFKREPPANFEGWLAFAKGQQCELDMHVYDQIYKDLDPWFQKGTIDPASVTRLKLEDHFQIAEFDADINNFTAPRFYEELFEPITHLLATNKKSFKIMLNKWDEPRIVKADNGGKIDLYNDMDDVFANSKCMRDKFDQPRKGAGWDGFDWMSGSKTVRSQHGFLMQPDSFGTRNIFAPVFSQAKVDCHLDIVMPLEYHIEITQKPVLDPYTWEQKKNVLFWRGTTTGGSFKNGAPWEHYPRIKMMNWEREFSRKYGHKYKGVTFDAGAGQEPPNKELSVDIGFSAVVQTDDVTTEIIRNRYPLKKRVSFEETKRFKYLIVVDGNTWPSRLQSYLQTNSVILYSGIFTDYYNWLLEPWVHYVPIKLDFSDLEEKLKWLMDHDDEARQISLNAQALVKKVAGRRRHLHCYTSLLLLEYSNLYGKSAIVG
ncbi:capsule-associated protein CAP1 [Rhizoclosmatium sp. JEL0117]|nr:capsule-associated protein CAP1 [Rhizoclosmatium hyalinum]KAJ3289435.1 capsule-associated protein CAP1 [Rhizoclosmatium sp. JEL0117]